MAKRPSTKKEPIDGEITETPEATTGTPPEHMDITDEQSAAPPEGDPRQWPESTETRDLPFDYDDAALAGMAMEMSKIIQKREVTKRTAKNVAATYKAEIDELDADLATISTDIEGGKGNQKVLCQWQYETSGKDTEGAFIYHPEMKTLFRVDTGEVVTVSPITEQERQMEMSLGGNPADWSAPEEPLGLPGPGESEAGDDGPALDTVD